MKKTTQEHLFKVTFYNRNKVYEIYARDVYQGNLYGFLEVEGLVFGERNSLVVDPSEEKLRAEFEHIRRSYIPLHNIIRIDEVPKKGKMQISDSKDQRIIQFTPPARNTNRGGGGEE